LVGPLLAPSLPGLYKALFRLQLVDDDEERLGQRLWCSIMSV
jgi:hypothetical protein